MEGNTFFIVDVFGREKYSGNQLAVVIIKNNPDGGEMQRVAADFNFSETAFILPGGTAEGGFDVRIFTPRGEVPFAGHPTLGTAWIIRERLLPVKTVRVVLNLKAGKIPVDFGRNGSDIVWMRQNRPAFGGTHDPRDVAPVICLGADDIDGRYPIQVVSTGLPFLMIPIRELEAIKRARTDRGAYEKYFRGKSPLPLYLFSPETHGKENRVNARMFADLFGITEDPATGSAAGCLGGYLAEHRYFGDGPVDISIEQGYDMGRESILYLRAEKSGGSFNIEVGGRVYAMAEGKLL